MPRLSHCSTSELELCYIGKIDEPQLAILEGYLDYCQHCLDRLEAIEAFINRVRAGRIRGKFDMETFSE